MEVKTIFTYVVHAELSSRWSIGDTMKATEREVGTAQYTENSYRLTQAYCRQGEQTTERTQRKIHIPACVPSQDQAFSAQPYADHDAKVSL